MLPWDFPLWTYAARDSPGGQVALERTVLPLRGSNRHGVAEVMDDQSRFS